MTNAAPPLNDGLQKAAALLMSIGVENSSTVLQHLSESEIERVLLAISSGGPVAMDLRRDAMNEAMAMSKAGVEIMSGGLEYSRQLLAKAVGPRRGTEILERISVRQQISSFEMLRNADPVQVAELLQEEHPQTIALVLSYLEAKLAAEILTHMPQEMQIDVTLRLATMERVSPQVLQVVEQRLKSKFSGVISEADFRATGGVDFLVKMLNQVDRGAQKQIFEALGSTNPKLVEDIQANLFTFDDLVTLDDRAIQRIMRDVNKSDLSLALKGAPPKLQDLIFRNMSGRARDNLKEEIDVLGPQLAKNVYDAQRRIVDIVRALEEAEEIVIGSGSDEEIIY